MFELDPRLAAETVELARWPLNRVLLMNDMNYPWFILVPQRPALRDFDQLEGGDRRTMDEEIVRACRILRAIAEPEKLNVASLGNSVAQLHVHVIGRFAHDAAWPRPVWGVAPPVPYSPHALARMRQGFADAALADLKRRYGGAGETGPC